MSTKHHAVNQAPQVLEPYWFWLKFFFSVFWLNRNCWSLETYEGICLVQDFWSQYIFHALCSCFTKVGFSKTPFFRAVSACAPEFDANKYAEILKEHIKISGSHSHKSWYVYLWAAGLKHTGSATLMATVLLMLMCRYSLNNLPILDCKFIGSVCTEHICGHLRQHEWGMNCLRGFYWWLIQHHCCVRVMELSTSNSGRELLRQLFLYITCFVDIFKISQTTQPSLSENISARHFPYTINPNLIISKFWALRLLC